MTNLYYFDKSVIFVVLALIVSGAYKLATAVNKPPPLTGEQAVKFTNYFLSRRSVQTSKGAYSLLDVLNTFTTNKVSFIMHTTRLIHNYCNFLVNICSRGEPWLYCLM